MTTPNSSYVEVPSNCPLPARCVACGAKPAGTIPVARSEGVPFIMSLHVTIHVPICEEHAQIYRRLSRRQRGYTLLAVLFALGSIIIAVKIGPGDVALYLIAGAIIAAVCAYISVRIHSDLYQKFGVRLKTMGRYPAYRLQVSNPQWNSDLLALIENYRKGARIDGASSSFRVGFHFHTK